MEIIRRNGPHALTARALGAELGVAASSVFTHFESMEAVDHAAMEAIRDIYEEYAQRGLAMNPPFKGFGMEMLRFAEEEPRLFSALLLTPDENGDVRSLADRGGSRERIISACAETFGIGMDVAEELYLFLWIYLCGMATLQATGARSFSEEERSTHLGNACRGFLMALLAGEDDRISLRPQKGQMIGGSVESYLKREERTK